LEAVRFNPALSWLKKRPLTFMDDPYAGMYEDRYAVTRLKKSVELAAPYLTSESVVIELGCYDEKLLQYLPEIKQYRGLDQRSSPSLDFDFPATLDEEPFPLPPADVLFCLETLEHLRNPKLLLHVFDRLLKPQGRIVISLPNEATLFHRIRALFGVIDAEAFKEGKHLSLPNIKQSREFINSFLQVEKTVYYINPGARKSRQSWLGKILTVLPDFFWEFLAFLCPSLFARGTIFLCRLRRTFP